MKSKNLGCCLDVAREPGKVALIEPLDWRAPRQTTYAELDAEADAVARGLVAKGFTRGTRIGILSLNRGEVITSYLGIMRAGMVAVPISFKLAPETVAFIVEDAALGAIFFDHDREALAGSKAMPIGFDAVGGYHDLLDFGPFDAIEPGPQEVAMMLYTSGSTGRPKGVLLSHESQLWALERGEEIYGDDAYHRYLVAAPFFHMNATISVTSAFYSGASVVLLPTFKADDFARAIDCFKVTWITSVPTMLAILAREADKLGNADFSSVVEVTMGSAPLTDALVQKVHAMFPQARVMNSYGTTEGGPSPFGPHPKGLPRPVTSIGFPSTGTEAELREGAHPDEGVLYMRSPMVMEGYHNLPEKTAAVLIDGWYRSGDIMRRDANGFFHFVGRDDDMFVVGGENVWPSEVEVLIESMPAVHQAAVVPVRDDIKGMVPFAFVVRRAGADLTEADVKTFTLENGAAFAHPRFVELVDEIPISGTNKPDKRRLLAQAEAILKTRRAGQGAPHE